MKTFYLFISLMAATISYGQAISSKLNTAVKTLERDNQFKHAIVSLYVVESKTGKVILDKNSQTGLAAASCQKIVTSASAFEILGQHFRYVTYIAKDFSVIGKGENGCLFVIGSGDPTVGSWRWQNTSDTAVFSTILTALKKQKITSFDEDLIIEDYLYGLTPLSDGWIWQDLGNYYGAACFGFNWHENQYDISLQPGKKEGDAVEVNAINPMLDNVILKNNIRTGKAGSGDNGYIYSSPFTNIIFCKGTIPLQKTGFTISGSMPNPSIVFANALYTYLIKNKIAINGKAYSANQSFINNKPVHKGTHFIDSIFSPSLDSMNYWFLKKSINLYGEAFLKSLVQKKMGLGIGDATYYKAIEVVKNFWKEKGIDHSALNIIDGSGLSPANRVTSNALVTVLQYAKQQQWFPSFYNALPEINGIKMKDGYINGVRSYSGYIKSKGGNEYTFSFIVNNFDGNAATVREKMWQVLDILK
jgi:D-alanyl-D-alanine carboxypeptidase/D-alanyl-D-alanine-endopeptidase (penicillin-binding protein 4)